MIELPIVHPTYSPVRCLMLYLTEDCNLRCTYCFVKKTPRTMTEQTAKKSVDYFLQRNVSGSMSKLVLNFFGGEPFMNLDVMEATIAYAGQAGLASRKTIEFSATTNATLATPRVEKVLRRSRMGLLVSMDGTEEAMSARPYATGGSPYKAVARNLKRLVAWSPSVIVRMTYHPEALNLVANVSRVLELGAPSVALVPVSESDWRGKEQVLEDAYQELADWFIGQARLGRYLPLELTWMLLRSHHWNSPRGLRPERPCQIGATLLGIDPDGNVMPCHRYLYRPQDWLGTVDDSTLPPSREQYVKIATADLLGCDSCLAQPVCGGGCRVVALLDGHDLHTGVHPGFCLNTRAHARAVYRIYDTLMKEQPEAFLTALHQHNRSAEQFGEYLNS